MARSHAAVSCRSFKWADFLLWKSHQNRNDTHDLSECWTLTIKANATFFFLGFSLFPCCIPRRKGKSSLTSSTNMRFTVREFWIPGPLVQFLSTESRLMLANRQGVVLETAHIQTPIEEALFKTWLKLHTPAPLLWLMQQCSFNDFIFSCFCWQHLQVYFTGNMLSKYEACTDSLKARNRSENTFDEMLQRERMSHDYDGEFSLRWGRPS